MNIMNKTNTKYDANLYTIIKNYTALLWQKEASDKSPKSEKFVF